MNSVFASVYFSRSSLNCEASFSFNSRYSRLHPARAFRSHAKLHNPPPLARGVFQEDVPLQESFSCVARPEKRIMSFRDAEREGPRLTKQGTVAFV
jgi:hypothetical protein